LKLAAAGKEVGMRDAAPVKHGGKECLVLGDSIVWDVGTEHTNTTSHCFPGIRNEQLHRVKENRDLGSPETVVIRVGTDD
jgi:hypothetical protein